MAKFYKINGPKIAKNGQKMTILGHFFQNSNSAKTAKNPQNAEILHFADNSASVGTLICVVSSQHYNIVVKV